MSELERDVVVAIISFIIAFISGYVVAKANIYSRDVIAERQKWRERIREIIVDAAQYIRNHDTHHDKFKALEAELILRLNPNSKYDKEIITTLKDDGKKDTDRIEELLEQVSKLLKHDWDRAKYEASLFSVFKPNEACIRQQRRPTESDEKQEMNNCGATNR